MSPPTYAQDKEPVSVTTPAGKDVLLFSRFVGDEALSKPFLFVVDMVSAKQDIAPATIVRKPLTINIDLDKGAIRYINGIVRRFAQLGRSKDGLVSYRAEVVPAFWLLSLSADCRIFQDKSVPDIIKKIFADAGITDYKTDLKGTHAVRTYCVQYRETNMDFVSRLCEEEGIFYFFEHANGKHTMVLSDNVASMKEGPLATIPMRWGGDAPVPDTINEFELRSYVSIGEVTLIDYNAETPKTKLIVQATGVEKMFGDPKNIIADYPGKFLKIADGEPIAKTRIEQGESTANTVTGATNYRGMASGQKFTVSEHYNTAANKPYNVVEAHHESESEAYRSSSGEKKPFSFVTKFVAMPSATPFRPARTTPKAIVHGSQTAVVVGPSGEEIYVDKYGRVKVQFFWDREGKLDDKSSCWVRVSSVWAGKNWGFIQIPRIGQEVIVDFLEGDPDQPIITGRVYNAEMMPPYDLPANGTQSGLKTRSSKGGSTDTFNELRFEDKKDSEEVYFKAQKDLNAFVKNDETHKVDHDRTTTIKNNETRTVTEGNDVTTISKGNQTLAVSKGDQTITVDKGKQTVTIEGDRTVTIKTGNETLTVNTGNQATTVKTGNVTTEVNTGNHSTTVKLGDMTMKASVGGINGEAMKAIELKVGANSIKIDQTGITIKGLNVKVEGSVMTEIKSPMATVKADGVLTLKGGVTMIN